LATYTFYPTPTGTIIEVDLPYTDVSIQELINEIRDWEDDLDNMEWPKLVDGAGKEDLGGGTAVGITLSLRDCKLKFADRPGPDWVVCNVGGGNLVATSGDLVTYVNPIEPSSYVTVTKTSSSSATLSTVELESLYYRGAVNIDNLIGETGTVFPLGTESNPVNNIADARVIADYYGFKTYNLKGMYVLDQDYNHWNFYGKNSILEDIIVVAGQNIQGASFDELIVTNYISGGNVQAQKCFFSNVTGFDGIIYEGALSGCTTVASGGTIMAKGTSIMGNPGCINLAATGAGVVANFEGDVEIMYATADNEINMSMSYGDVIISPTCSGATFEVGGFGEVYNYGTGCTVINTTLTDVVNKLNKKVLGLY